MRSRRDQLRAYRFVTRRIVSALLSGEPENPEQPMRRANVTTFAGIMIAVLVLAGFAVYGWVRGGGNTAWRDGESLIVEKETGALYVYVPEDGRLYGILNYTSARLFLRKADMKVERISRKSLAGVARGRTIGIEGAPASLPAADKLLRAPWSVCSARREQAPVATVLVGSPAPSAGDLGEQGLLVRAGTDTALLWKGQRLSIPGDRELNRLEWGSIPVLPVAQRFLDSLPAGAPLAAPSVAGTGRLTIAGRSYPSGDVLRNGQDHFLVTARGLATITPLQARLAPGETHDVRPDDLPRPVEDLIPANFPRNAPELRPTEESTAVCASHDAAAGKFTIGTSAEASGSLVGEERVVVPGGRGALVQSVTGPGTTGTVFLVTDDGRRYGVVPDALGPLGYGQVPPVPVPSDLLDQLDPGPGLDPAALGFVRGPGPGTGSPTPAGSGTGSPSP